MNIVLKDFYCTVEKKVYSTGDEYKGKRAEELTAKGYVEGSNNQSKKDTKAVK